jgi:transposase
MTNYRELLRLHAGGISQRNIAASLGCSRNTVAKVLERADAQQLSWPIPETTTNVDLKDQLFPDRGEVSIRQKPDFEYIYQELEKSGVTLSLLWAEYCEKCRTGETIPYKYTQYCKLYRDYAKKHKATMRIHHKPGQKMEIDWAGDTAHIIDNITGEQIKAYLFVAVLPYSMMGYVEACLETNMENWISSHTHAFDYFGGVTRILVSDNLKTGVDRIKRSGPVINRVYQEMAEYYDTVVIPARVRRPKDKPSAEGTVKVIGTWIVAALRNQEFFSIADLNEAIRRKLEEFNSKPFQKKDGSRKSVFLSEEKHTLLPLPHNAYELATWKIATVQYNYHISVEKMQYSVPYEYIKKKVDVRMTKHAVEVFYAGNRIASHIRMRGVPNQYSTTPEHMPEKHRKYLEWNSERFISWAREIGPHTETVIKSLLFTKKIEQQGYRSCMALLKSAEKYSEERVESACGKALEYTPSPSYKIVQTILKNGSDLLPEQQKPTQKPDDQAFGFVRGAEYFGRKPS